MHRHVAGDVFDGCSTPLPALVDIEGVDGDAMVDLGVQIKTSVKALVECVPRLPNIQGNQKKHVYVDPKAIVVCPGRLRCCGTIYTE
jgi:hypothetical protein